VPNLRKRFTVVGAGAVPAEPLKTSRLLKAAVAPIFHGCEIEWVKFAISGKILGCVRDQRSLHRYNYRDAMEIACCEWWTRMAACSRAAAVAIHAPGAENISRQSLTFHCHGGAGQSGRSRM